MVELHVQMIETKNADVDKMFNWVQDANNENNNESQCLQAIRAEINQSESSIVSRDQDLTNQSSALRGWMRAAQVIWLRVSSCSVRAAVQC